MRRMKESSSSGARCGEEMESARESWGIMGRLQETRIRPEHEGKEYWYTLFFEKATKELTKLLVLFHVVNLRVAPKSVEAVSECKFQAPSSPSPFEGRPIRLTCDECSGTLPLIARTSYTPHIFFSVTTT